MRNMLNRLITRSPELDSAKESFESTPNPETLNKLLTEMNKILKERPTTDLYRAGVAHRANKIKSMMKELSEGKNTPEIFKATLTEISTLCNDIDKKAFKPDQLEAQIKKINATLNNPQTQPSDIQALTQALYKTKAIQEKSPEKYTQRFLRGMGMVDNETAETLNKNLEELWQNRKLQAKHIQALMLAGLDSSENTNIKERYDKYLDKYLEDPITELDVDKLFHQISTDEYAGHVNDALTVQPSSLMVWIWELMLERIKNFAPTRAKRQKVLTTLGRPTKRQKVLTELGSTKLPITFTQLNTVHEHLCKLEDALDKIEVSSLFLRDLTFENLSELQQKLGDKYSKLNQTGKDLVATIKSTCQNCRSQEVIHDVYNQYQIDLRYKTKFIQDLTEDIASYLNSHIRLNPAASTWRRKDLSLLQSKKGPGQPTSSGARCVGRLRPA